MGTPAAGGLAVGGRGDRFARRVRGQPVETFGHERRTRVWRWAASTHTERWPVAIGLLQLRDRIDAELSGQRLAVLAQSVGEDVFDAICAEPVAPAVDLPGGPLSPATARAVGQAAIAAAATEHRGRDARTLDRVAAILAATA